MENIQGIKSVYLDDEKNIVVILDQTLLPREKVFLEVDKIEDLYEAIHSLRVRGAPAIGIAAAYGVYLFTKLVEAGDFESLYEAFKKNKDYIESSRPTAVNLSWALKRMENRLISEKDKKVDEIKLALLDEANQIREEDEAVCKAIGENALTLLKDGYGLLTHCNPGGIATAKYGTALAPIFLGLERGVNFKVFVDETRPLLQGARLTAWELHESGVDTTLICDNMAATVMNQGKVNAVLVGCDRVALNGDSANKIGTMPLAIVAKHFNIPFYVCAPISTIDISCKDENDIEIEIRNGDEITEKWYENRVAPKGVKTYNPCFDVTPNNLITAIITEKGIIYPPFHEGIKKLFEGDK
ncbi:S-methyl-5-thioribose-1-phosphate isomerase [Clostridium cylindrosporum]|uniref:Methylthioribose-1-phosphate isomerase n=1 Tax=Clostridium cylindrosporum DSM 605 TaxID=1121307 RepID=A0A0J8DE05_CLOCY|nr:S-methyl-5-thioribose-1-phosphate isomerase [Clostridium cylindrosporum]KMT22448.1 methylthioribose-1-phosphate isomerase MtnA [Clostridium cylindrosporum DSM 605]